jgi:hypothetical protein
MRGYVRLCAEWCAAGNQRVKIQMRNSRYNREQKHPGTRAQGQSRWKIGRNFPDAVAVRMSRACERHTECACDFACKGVPRGLSPPSKESSRSFHHGGHREHREESQRFRNPLLRPHHIHSLCVSSVLSVNSVVKSPPHHFPGERAESLRGFRYDLCGLLFPQASPSHDSTISCTISSSSVS